MPRTRSIKKPTIRGRTLASLARQLSGSFSVDSVIEQARADAKATNQPLGPRTLVMIEREIQGLTCQGHLQWRAPKRYKPTRTTRDKLKDRAGAYPQQELTQRQRYNTECADLRATFGPSHRENVITAYDKRFEAIGPVHPSQSSMQPVDDLVMSSAVGSDLPATPNVQDLLIDEPASNPNDLTASADVSHVASDAASDAMQVVVENASGMGTDVLSSPVRKRNLLADAEDAYPSPVSNIRRPLGRVPTELIEHSSPSPSSRTASSGINGGAATCPDADMDDGTNGADHEMSQPLNQISTGASRRWSSLVPGSLGELIRAAPLPDINMDVRLGSSSVVPVPARVTADASVQMNAPQKRGDISTEAGVAALELDLFIIRSQLRRANNKKHRLRIKLEGAKTENEELKTEIAQCQVKIDELQRKVKTNKKLVKWYEKRPVP